MEERNSELRGPAFGEAAVDCGKKASREERNGGCCEEETGSDEEAAYRQPSSDCHQLQRLQVAAAAERGGVRKRAKDFHVIDGRLHHKGKDVAGAAKRGIGDTGI